MLVARCRTVRPFITARQFHATRTIGYPRRRSADLQENPNDDPFDIDAIPEYEEDDATATGHLVIQQQRQLLHYLRCIERDGPLLKKLRKPFIPPTSKIPLIFRTISYGGESHPASRKQVLVVAISQLPLNTPEAIHKAKLLAGPRWLDKPTPDSGYSQEEHAKIGEHGYIKISSEDFPERAMNLKWASDVLDNLLKEANDPRDTFAQVPHDTRHLVAKALKDQKGEHVSGRLGPRPSLKDFPREWLPNKQQDAQTVQNS